jgi:hypothetical protein
VADGPEEPACRPTLTPVTLIFCFFAVSRAERSPAKVNSSAAHDSLQVPVKYDDIIFQSHRQIHALV